MTIKLHCFGESGNAYKAALTMTLAVLGSNGSRSLSTSSMVPAVPRSFGR
jgi:hypothetical protein